MLDRYRSTGTGVQGEEYKMTRQEVMETQSSSWRLISSERTGVFLTGFQMSHSLKEKSLSFKEKSHSLKEKSSSLKEKLHTFKD